ncbi:MAG: hypothetical protein ACRD0Q_05160 [Acidimicrobiales bacterium]
MTLALYETGPQLSFVLGSFGVIEMGSPTPTTPRSAYRGPSCT